jgi:ketosteroid isomerase-like protein
MSRTDEDTIRQAYAAFNDRDIERAVTMMDPNVEWPDVVDGGFVHGHGGVRRHWRDVFASADTRIEINDLARRPDRSVAAHVRQVVVGPGGQTLSEHRLIHVFRLDDGLITRMDVEPPN